MLTANLWGHSTCWALSQMLRNAQCPERPKRELKPRQLCDVGREEEGLFLSSSLTLEGEQGRKLESKDEPSWYWGPSWDGNAGTEAEVLHLKTRPAPRTQSVSL